MWKHILNTDVEEVIALAIERKDEVLGKALETDESVIPRFDVVRPDGSKVAENVEIRLKNPVTQEGMPINRNAMNECLAASGVTEGTDTAYTLEQPGFALADGVLIRFRLHVDSGATPTINVNNTGAKALMVSKYKPMKAGTAAGIWLSAVYSSELGFFVLQGSSDGSVITFGNDIGQVSTYEWFFRGGKNTHYRR